MNDPSKLVETFVDVGPLFTLLSSKDHQILYGRRGTGKTHVLSYLVETMRKANDAAIYLDLRTIGSTTGLYSDISLSIGQRATRLLSDTLIAIHEGLVNYCVEKAEEFDLSYTGPLLDQLAESITRVVVSGTVERTTKTSSGTESSDSSSIEVSVGLDELKSKIGDTSKDSRRKQDESDLTESGVYDYSLNFGHVGRSFNAIAHALRGQRIWLVLDEWSSIPFNLQPLLADLFRRSILPISNCTVKIAAIEQRSRFRISTNKGDYTGIEIGADVTADLSLDDFMVFDNDAEQAKSFFKELLFRHWKAESGDSSEVHSSDQLIHDGFTQITAFDEFVRATEGVPRDAINIINMAAQKALDERVAVSHIRIAARNWYQRDKESSLRDYARAHDLLH